MKFPWLATLVPPIAAVLISGCKTETEVSIIRPVRAIKIGDVAGINGAVFPGRARAAEQVNLAFRVPGELELLNVEVGMVVKKGDVLARVDQRDFQATVDTADAELERAIARLDAMKIARPEEIRKLGAQVKESEAVLALAQAEHDRNKRLQKQGVGAVSQTELDRSLASRDRSNALVEQSKESLKIAQEGARPEDIRAQQAEVKSFEAKLASANNNLLYTELTAPFDGTIAAKYVENYQTVQAAEVICRLLDTSKIEVVIDVPESKIALASSVRDVVAVFDAFPGLALEGAKIVEIGNEASATTRTFPVTVRMNQPDESTGAKILPGMAGRVSGTAELTDEMAAKGFVIPESALFETDDGKKHVWLIDDDAMTVHLSQNVNVGQLSALGVHVKGIDAGQWVVTAGVHYLEEGQTVRILEEPATTFQRQPEATDTEPATQPAEATE